MYVYMSLVDFQSMCRDAFIVQFTSIDVAHYVGLLGVVSRSTSAMISLIGAFYVHVYILSYIHLPEFMCDLG